MSINLKNEFLGWNENQIEKYEKLLLITNKSMLLNKYKEKIKKHVKARNSVKLLSELFSGYNWNESAKELKKLGLIKRIK